MFSKISGFALIIIGLAMIIYTGFNIVKKEKIAAIGPIEITSQKNNTVEWSPILGAVFVVGGILILALYKKEIPEY